MCVFLFLFVRAQQSKECTETELLQRLEGGSLKYVSLSGQL